MQTLLSATDMSMIKEHVSQIPRRRLELQRKLKLRRNAGNLECPGLPLGFLTGNTPPERILHEYI